MTIIQVVTIYKWYTCTWNRINNRYMWCKYDNMYWYFRITCLLLVLANVPTIKYHCWWMLRHGLDAYDKIRTSSVQKVTMFSFTPVDSYWAPMTLGMYGHISYVGHAALINCICNVIFSVVPFSMVPALNIIEYWHW